MYLLFIIHFNKKDENYHHLGTIRRKLLKSVLWEKSVKKSVEQCTFSKILYFYGKVCKCENTAFIAKDFIHFFIRKSLRVSQSYHFYSETTQTTKHKKSVSWNNVIKPEKPQHTLHVLCNFVLLLWTCFLAFSQVICS